jgi:hypothetical protein
MSDRSGILSLLIILAVLGCGSGKTEDSDIVSRGPIRFVKKLKYGSVGTHGGKGFYVESRHIFINDKEWFPPEGPELVKDIASCEFSPNEKLEIMKCLVISYDRGGTFLLTLENGEPVFKRVSNGHADKDEGEWVNLDGRWLLFQNYFINAETGERRDIVPLPEGPGGSYAKLIGVSPDLRTVVFAGDFDPPNIGKERMATFRLIDTGTGTIDEQRFNLTRHPWIYDSEIRPMNLPARHLWVSSKFIWEKDHNGRDKLVFPVLLGPAGVEKRP